jgi:hydroxylamine dehydrogenase
MADNERQGVMKGARLLVIGLVAVIVVLGLAVIVLAIGRGGQRPSEQVNVLANSNDPCVKCHRRSTPGIVEQFGHSAMAAADVSCMDCHRAEEGQPGAIQHEGYTILGEPTPASCERCHPKEVAEFDQSRHSLPAYVAYAGSEGLDSAQLAEYQSIPEGTYKPDQSRNALFALEGDSVTRFACQVCHAIGKPRVDGSVGDCTKCHLRHEFSLEQARKPETCNACHIGPDHPQYEIYTESPHGIMYHTGGDRWNWDAEAGTLTPKDFPAPTCAICHMSGFGNSATTHDVGDRLTWYLFAPISTRRPSWQDNRTRMQNVCRTCHNEEFVKEFYAKADEATVAINGFIARSDSIMAPLQARGLLTPQPFDEPIDFTYFDTWHFYGRTAKFGAWMQGPDYTQWHGAYEILSHLAELRKEAKEKMEQAGGRR